MICRGVEISIAGGGGEMLRGPISWLLLFFCFFCNHAFIVLGTKNLMQPELLREQNL